MQGFTKTKRTLVFWEVLGRSKGIESYNYWNLQLHYLTDLYSRILFITSDTNLNAEDFPNLEFKVKRYYKGIRKNKILKVIQYVFSDIRFLCMLLFNRQEKKVLLNIYGLRWYESILTVFVKLLTNGDVYILLHDL